MGLRNLFKKKKPTHEEKLALAYRCYKPEMVGIIFPKGTKQANKVVLSLTKILHVDLEKSDVKTYYDILTIYSDVLIRKKVTNSTDDHIIVSLQMKHENLINNNDMAKKTLVFCTINLLNNEYELADEGDIDNLSQIASMLAE